MSVITLKHPSGILKKAPLGFSWKAMVFSALVPLYRGDRYWFAMMSFFYVFDTVMRHFAFHDTATHADFKAYLEFAIPYIIMYVLFAFMYNTLYIKDLLEKGYIPADPASKAALQAQGILEGR